jgi:hypothetical protein
VSTALDTEPLRAMAAVLRGLATCAAQGIDPRSGAEIVGDRTTAGGAGLARGVVSECASEPMPRARDLADRAVQRIEPVSFWRRVVGHRATVGGAGFV